MAVQKTEIEGWACFDFLNGTKSAMSPDQNTELFWKSTFGITGCFEDETRMPPAVAKWLFDIP